MSSRRSVTSPNKLLSNETDFHFLSITSMGGFSPICYEITLVKQFYSCIVYKCHIFILSVYSLIYCMRARKKYGYIINNGTCYIIGHEEAGVTSTIIK